MNHLDIDRLIAMLQPQCDKKTLAFVKSVLTANDPASKPPPGRSESQDIDPFEYGDPINDPRHW